MDVSKMVARAAPALDDEALISLTNACLTELQLRVGGVIRRRLTAMQVAAFERDLEEGDKSAAEWLNRVVPDNGAIVHDVARELFSEVADRFGGSVETDDQPVVANGRAGGGA